MTFAGSGDAFGSGGRFQACIHVRSRDHAPVLLDCGATSLSALKAAGLDPGEIGVVFVSHLHGRPFRRAPVPDPRWSVHPRTSPLTVAGPPGTGARLREVMEALFPGSGDAARRFDVRVAELVPGGTETVAGIAVTSWEVDHPSGAPPLALRLEVGGRTIAYTGDTTWTDDLVAVASDADLLIAEAYYFDKPVPSHLRHADIAAHRGELTSRRIVLTHLSTDMLAQDDHVDFDTACDGLVVMP